MKFNSFIALLITLSLVLSQELLPLEVLEKSVIRSNNRELIKKLQRHLTEREAARVVNLEPQQKPSTYDTLKRVVTKVKDIWERIIERSEETQWEIDEAIKTKIDAIGN